MTDTTDQQAVTVAQKQAQFINDLIITPVSDPNAGAKNGSELIRAKAAARKILASVSSASAELPADVRGLVIAAREFWENEDSGTIRSHALDKALEAFSSRVPYDDEPTPEPVPATNQAGEVAIEQGVADRIMHVLNVAANYATAEANGGEFSEQHRADLASMNGDIISDDRRILFAALATQPTTSQKGEGDFPTDGTCRVCSSAPVEPISGLCATCIDEQPPATSQKGERHPGWTEAGHKWLEAGCPPVAATPNLAATPKEADWVAVPRVPTEAMLKAGQAAADDHRWKWCGYGPREPGQGLDGMMFHVREAFTAMLAATPTPPTLSEDLNVDAIVKESLSIATLGTPGQIAVQIATNAVRTTLAALATQPATSQEAKPCSTGKEKDAIAETALGFRGDRTEHGGRENVTGQSSDRLSEEEKARANEMLDLFAPLSVSSTWEPSERRTIIRAMLAYGDIVAAVTNSERDAEQSTSQDSDDAARANGVEQDELVAGLKRALQHPAGDHDGWTDAGMEDAFFRWPVIVNALNEALSLLNTASDEPCNEDGTTDFNRATQPATSQEGETCGWCRDFPDSPNCDCAATPTPPAVSEDLRELVGTGHFILDRLVDHEVRMTSDDDAREWYGHVTPAMERFRAALAQVKAS